MIPVDELIQEVKLAAKCVFSELGGGHSESVMEAALEVELMLRGIGPIKRQVVCPIWYKETAVGYGFLDLVISDQLVIELKTQAGISVKDEFQIQKYLTSLNIQTGLLINFGLEKTTARVIECQRCT